LRLIFVDKQTLVANKAAAGRLKDLADLDALSPCVEHDADPERD
jgi:hypothetical protein